MRGIEDLSKYMVAGALVCSVGLERAISGMGKLLGSGSVNQCVCIPNNPDEAGFLAYLSHPRGLHNSQLGYWKVVDVSLPCANKPTLFDPGYFGNNISASLRLDHACRRDLSAPNTLIDILDREGVLHRWHNSKMTGSLPFARQTVLAGSLASLRAPMLVAESISQSGLIYQR